MNSRKEGGEKKSPVHRERKGREVRINNLSGKK
jgi:hypothetical protein